MSTGTIDTIAGTGTGSYSGDNVQATSATLNYPKDVAVDSSGTLYILNISSKAFNFTGHLFLRQCLHR